MTKDVYISNDEIVTNHDIEKYQSMIESMMFVMIETRSNIAFVIFMLSRFAKNPTKTHIEAIKRIIRYLKSTKNQGITYEGVSLKMVGYSNSDWAGNKEIRRSTTGFIFMLNNGPII